MNFVLNRISFHLHGNLCVFAGVREIYTGSNVQLQTIAAMPVEPSTISLGGILHPDETKSDKVCCGWNYSNLFRLNRSADFDFHN